MKAAAPTATNGSRAWPVKTSQKDKQIGMRLDWGEIFTGVDGAQHRNLVLQVNKDAEHPTLKALANKGTHKAIATLTMKVENDTSTENDFLKKWLDEL